MERERIGRESPRDDGRKARGDKIRLASGRLGAEVFRRAGEIAAQAVEPPADIHASSGYRRHLTGVLVRRALATAESRIKGQA